MDRGAERMASRRAEPGRFHPCADPAHARGQRARQQEFLADWLALSLSMAIINQRIHEAARAVESCDRAGSKMTHAREVELLPAPTRAVETAWKERGRLLWPWVFTCATAKLFNACRRLADDPPAPADQPTPAALDPHRMRTRAGKACYAHHKSTVATSSTRWASGSSCCAVAVQFSAGRVRAGVSGVEPQAPLCV